jgi:glycosyltransferase involved in cell wall biosynthesis
MDKIAVLIPCYNEAQTIAQVVSDYRAALPEATVYVYDNNSTDGADDIARAAGAIVRRERVQGKGNVIRRMFREIDAQAYIMIDGDNTYPASAAREMIDAVIDEQADMVVGDRLSSTYFTENKRFMHNAGNIYMRKLINFLFRGDIKDIMTGMRAFSYEFVKTFPVLSFGFEIETEMTIHAIDKNMLIKNIAIDYRDRPEGSVSKLNTITDGARVITMALKLFKNYKPFAFFGMIGLIILLISAGVFAFDVVPGYLRTGLVARFPTLIVCAFAALAGLLTIASGMILSAGVDANKREFEFRLQLIANEKKRLLAQYSADEDLIRLPK